MRTVTADDIAQLTDLFFAAIYDDRQWPAAASQLRSVLNGADASVGMMDTRTRTQFVIYGDCDEVFRDRFVLPEMDNPTMSTLMHGRVGDFIGVLPSAELPHSVFYNQWLLPQGARGMLGVKTLGNGRMVASIGVTRGLGQPDIDSADIAVLRSLSPMLTRVSAMRAQIGALRLTERGETYDRLSIGVAVIDSNCRLLHHNDAADRIFVEPDSGVGVSGGRMNAGEQTSLLRRLVVDVLHGTGDAPGVGGYFSVAGARAGYAITVAPMVDAGSYGLPVGRAAIVFIQPLGSIPPGFEERISGLFGATRTEALVAAALVAGDSLGDIAEARGISITTVRTHLAQLFRKTGTSKQGQLVALLRGVLPLGN